MCGSWAWAWLAASGRGPNLQTEASEQTTESAGSWHMVSPEAKEELGQKEQAAAES